MDRNTEVKILLLDFETSPWVAECYGKIWEPVVMDIKEFSQILSVAYRWYGETKTHYLGQNEIEGYKKGKLNDKKLLEIFSEVIKQADYIVAHNGDKFDWLMIKERIMFHRLQPLPEIPSFDTKKLFAQNSNLPSNKLNYASVFMGNGRKMEHADNLFSKCKAGDENAWRINKKYNKRDVDVMYDDFKDIMPYVKLSSKQTVFSSGVQCKNPLCLSYQVAKSKRSRVKNGWKIQYQCNKCGRYFTSDKIIKDE